MRSRGLRRVMTMPNIDVCWLGPDDKALANRAMREVLEEAGGIAEGWLADARAGQYTRRGTIRVVIHGIYQWVNSETGVVSLTLLTVVAALATALALRRERPKTAIQIQRMSGHYDRATSTLVVNVQVFAAPPIPGMIADIQSWWTVKIGYVPVELLITKIDRTSLRRNLAFVTLSGQTSLVPPAGADVSVMFRSKVVGGGSAKKRETIHIV